MLPQLFTVDAALWGPMRSGEQLVGVGVVACGRSGAGCDHTVFASAVGLQGTLAMLFCGVDVAATGCLLAFKDLGAQCLQAPWPRGSNPCQ